VLPRQTLLAAELESIRVELCEATLKGEERRARPGHGGVHASLAAVNKALAHGGGAAAASASGRTHGAEAPGVVRRVKLYDTGAPAGTLKLRYTQRHKLQNLGLLPGGVGVGEAVPRVKREAPAPAAAAGAAGAAGAAAAGGEAAGAGVSKRARPAAPVFVELLD
jgi:hypothetical protein